MDINMNCGNKDVQIDKLVELTFGRLMTAGYEIIELDKEINNAAEIKVASFDEYIKVINRGNVKFIFAYRYNGIKEVAKYGVEELKSFNLFHLVHKFENICNELKNKYKDSYINLYASIDGVVTVVRLKFITGDIFESLIDIGNKIGYNFHIKEPKNVEDN